MDRRVETDAVATMGPPPTETWALSRSNSSSISWRVRFLVPRMSMEAAKDPSVARPLSASSVPKRKVN